MEVETLIIYTINDNPAKFKIIYQLSLNLIRMLLLKIAATQC